MATADKDKTFMLSTPPILLQIPQTPKEIKQWDQEFTAHALMHFVNNPQLLALVSSMEGPQNALCLANAVRHILTREPAKCCKTISLRIGSLGFKRANNAPTWWEFGDREFTRASQFITPTLPPNSALAHHEWLNDDPAAGIRVTTYPTFPVVKFNDETGEETEAPLQEVVWGKYSVAAHCWAVETWEEEEEENDENKKEEVERAGEGQEKRRARRTTVIVDPWFPQYDHVIAARDATHERSRTVIRGPEAVKLLDAMIERLVIHCGPDWEEIKQREFVDLVEKAHLPGLVNFNNTADMFF